MYGGQDNKNTISVLKDSLNSECNLLCIYILLQAIFLFESTLKGGGRVWTPDAIGWIVRL